MSFNETSIINFELTTKTWGLEKGRYGGFSLPILLNKDIEDQIKAAAKEHDAKNPIYGRDKECPGTLYIIIPNLSNKQKTELLNKDRRDILVHFKLSGVEVNKKKEKCLKFKVTKLRRVEGECDEEPED